jgi:hypothetical protein
MTSYELALTISLAVFCCGTLAIALARSIVSDYQRPETLAMRILTSLLWAVPIVSGAAALASGAFMALSR